MLYKMLIHFRLRGLSHSQAELLRYMKIWRQDIAQWDSNEKCKIYFINNLTRPGMKYNFLNLNIFGN